MTNPFLADILVADHMHSLRDAADKHRRWMPFRRSAAQHPRQVRAPLTMASTSTIDSSCDRAVA